MIICVSRPDSSAANIYLGGTRDFAQLPEGACRVDLIFRDSSRYSFPVSLQKNGLNYLKVDSVAPAAADSISRKAFDLMRSRLKISYPSNPLLNEEDYFAIDEVVIIGSSRTRLTISAASVEGGKGVDIADLAQHKVVAEAMVGNAAGVKVTDSADGIRIRGYNSVSSGPQPLIILNGVPYDGDLSDLDKMTFASINIMKDATSIYGSRAANGVILIVTNDAVSDTESGFPDDWRNATALRTNFHDDAFWYPALSTGKDGRATFEVTYPDDITSWNANFIAVGGRRQTDSKQLNIKSFKPINAQLSLPHFAILGDSLNAVGRLTNHLGDTVKVKRSIEVEGRSSVENISLPGVVCRQYPHRRNRTG